jgi:hypothetical protein
MNGAETRKLGTAWEHNRRLDLLGLDEERHRHHLAGLQILDLDPCDAEEDEIRIFRSGPELARNEI